MKDAPVDKLLPPNQVLGPELASSPPILIQYTKFKCGGVSLGLSWAHVLGDVFTTTEFWNLLEKVYGGYQLRKPLNLAHSLTKANSTQTMQKIVEDPLSIKRVDRVEDHWNNSCKMKSFSIHVSASKLDQLQSKLGIQGPFESLCIVIWRSISRIRDGPDPQVVTICKKGEEKKEGLIGNTQVIGVVKVDYSISEVNPSQLEGLIKNEIIDERLKIDEAIEKEQGVSNVVVYGANLTFVNVEGADLYGFDWGGHKPRNVSYLIDGVGDAGTVLVLPAGPNEAEGKIVTLTLRKDEIMKLKNELNSEWLVYGANLTFVNVEGADLYGFDWRGHKPRNVSYLIDGVGDAGAVLVLPAGPNEAEGKIVTLTLPEDEIMKLKNELNSEWFIA
ncbi:hypothetical protein BC332_33950 [Capsicum chinense]|nr:hypothetical protein BC332_33950 [Capsicum chinense]